MPIVERGDRTSTFLAVALFFGEIIDHAAAMGHGQGKSLRQGTIHTVALLGNHAPRQCGIATFTTDLSEAIANEFPGLDCFVLAMNDRGRRHAYPRRVRFEISETDTPSYLRAADFLNVNPVDVLCVQHEYGIFGGKAGSHVLALLRELRMPIVTTLHTILAEPNPQQRMVMDELAKLSERFVVMSALGAELLHSVHGVEKAKIDLIPHGIPDVPFAGGSKAQLGVAGKSVILTFGLLSPDKGIENVIDALPAILERHPNTVYIVLGATHPHVKEHQGETYRLMLENRALRLGVSSSVIFHNRFVSQLELTEFLAAADIYITPYLKPEQITSGTLAYAVGSGKAVISTPYWYARELLAEDRGILVPWPKDDPHAIGRAIIDLLSDDPKRLALRQRARAHGRNMLWPEVARSYLHSFERARTEQTDRLRNVFMAKTLATRPLELPEVKLDHLMLLSDQTGILQHAIFSIPRYQDGYCLDDNARALLLMILLEESGSEDVKEVRKLASRYLAFVSDAFNRDTGRFRNFMSYSRTWLEDQGSEDCHGRALWALGTVVGRGGNPGRESLAGQLFHGALSKTVHFSSPRAWAFALLGIDEYLRAFQGDIEVQRIRNELALKLLDVYQRSSHSDWPWFEQGLSYENARLPQALLVSGRKMRSQEMMTVGLKSLEWLVDNQLTSDNYFAPIGSNGFWRRGGKKALFDQQPVEAGGMVSACLEARRSTRDEKWSARARRAFSWFHGQNQLQTSLYDASTGGCRDGLHSDRANENQGAESTLAFLMALVEMRLADQLDFDITPAREIATT